MTETRTALERGSIKGFEDRRMVMLFSMMDGDDEVPCAVSNRAMDEMEHVPWTADNQRTCSLQTGVTCKRALTFDYVEVSAAPRA